MPSNTDSTTRPRPRLSAASAARLATPWPVALQPAGAVAARCREPPALEAVGGVLAEPFGAARAARRGVRMPTAGPADLCL
eukprot:6030018-Alexandrium_andersonii.AAC.1